MSEPDQPQPPLTQDELDELLAEVTAILNDGTADTKEFWKAYIKRDRKRSPEKRSQAAGTWLWRMPAFEERKGPTATQR